MALPPFYRKSRENAIVSYDYTELSEGTGVINYGVYRSLTGVDPSPTETLFLTTQNYDTGTDTVEENETKDADLTQFNLPREIQGTGICSGIMNNDASSSIGIGITLKKVSGVDVTTIGSETSYTSQIISAAGTKDFLFQFDIPKTHFKKGDILRVTIDGKGTSGRIQLGPRTSDQFKLSIPYKIEI